MINPNHDLDRGEPAEFVTTHQDLDDGQTYHEAGRYHNSLYESIYSLTFGIRLQHPGFAKQQCNRERGYTYKWLPDVDSI